MRTAADALAVLEDFRKTLPRGHQELPGVIRAIEVLRHEIEQTARADKIRHVKSGEWGPQNLQHHLYSDHHLSPPPYDPDLLNAIHQQLHASGEEH